ncbi:MAG: bifunctional glycosyltransferase family 2 protein/CDP-glycerol:glycerophosphate glycerophosphotransferase [Clostridiales bacterium]|nr:bifunctional glycosyltransferase family 2 protein/CDP-glycerol:glycerophosphate glycerophosphotransferase [Clostridiales bacterium]
MNERNNELSQALRRWLLEADCGQWPQLTVSELAVQGEVLSFLPPEKSGPWREGRAALLVKRGKLRLVFPLSVGPEGRLSAGLAQVEELIRSKKDKSAEVFLAVEGEEGTPMGWQLYGASLLGQTLRERPSQSSMLVRQVCRHLQPVARKTVNGVTLCAQPYLQLNTSKLLIQFATAERAERMAGERWTQSREEYHGGERYQLSVVLTADAESFSLRGAVESLLNQKWDFRKHIQLILCDFHTGEAETALCVEYRDKYPKNIQVLDVSGCTSAQAKNAGMARAEGKYLVFLSAHHRFSEDACGLLYDFAEQNYQSADVFVMPTVFSGAQIKEYWRNSWCNVAQVVNLDEKQGYAQCTLAASFLKREVAQRYCFEAEEAEGGDTLFLLKLLLEKRTIGLNNQGRSIFDCSNKEREPKAWDYAQDPAWYDRYFDNLPKGILDYCQETLGWTPRFVPRYLMTELVWRFRQKALPSEDPAWKAHYVNNFRAALNLLDDRDILSVKKLLTPFERIQLFTLKYDHAPSIDYRWHNAVLRMEETPLGSIGKYPVNVDFMELQNGHFSIEGYIPLPPTVDPEQVSVWLQAGSQWLPCTRPPRVLDNENMFGTLFQYVTFYGEVPLTDEMMDQKIILFYAINGHLIRCRYLSMKKDCPMNSFWQNPYYYKDGVVLTRERSSLFLHRCKTLQQRMEYEKTFMAEVRETVGRLSPYHPLAEVDVAAVARLRERAIRYKMNPRRREIWLVSDRINRGDDNGEVFFQYMQKQQKKWGRKVYFVIEKDCEDYDRIRKFGPVLSTLSEEHKYNHLIADWVISSQANDPVLRPFGQETMLYQDLCHDYKFAFLQHGVIKDDLSGWLNRYNRKMEGFVVTTNPEYQSILDYNYYQPPENVWLTGLPRHDALYHDEKKYITIMPTWRKTLTKGMDPETSVWLVVDNFESSDYYQFYNGLLNSPRLLERAEQLGYTLCFKPHPNVLPVINRFQRDPRVIFFPENKSYREVYAQSSLIVTDFSSAIFDFVLMDKPVVYAQFDVADFFSGGHSYVEGYYDYQRDGFGEVEYTLEGTIDRIIEYMERDCKLKPQYEERIQQTFAFHDRNNCQRVYEKIMEHSDKKR